MSTNLANLLYLITIVTFILALRFLSNPAHARRGNQIGAAGMLLAVAVTFAKSGMTSYWEIVVGMLIGGGFGAVAARKVRMTAMPQMVALFNGVGGGAAALVSLAEFHNLAPSPGRLHGDVSVAIVASAPSCPASTCGRSSRSRSSRWARASSTSAFAARRPPAATRPS